MANTLRWSMSHLDMRQSMTRLDILLHNWQKEIDRKKAKTKRKGKNERITNN